MNTQEAQIIFSNFLKIHWPWNHFALRSIFFSKIPESFLPYPKQVIADAIRVLMESDYIDYKEYSKEYINNILKKVHIALDLYVSDDVAVKQLVTISSNDNMLDILKNNIKEYSIAAKKSCENEVVTEIDAKYQSGL